MWQNKYLASIIIFLTELAVICLLVPVRVVEGAINDEYKMSVNSLGTELADKVYDRAKKDYESLIIESGVYTAVVRHFIPTDEERRNSVGMEELGTRDGWFPLVQNRINTTTSIIYQLLVRYEVMMIWLPYVLIFVSFPVCIGGYWQRRIKQSNFDYSSPLVTNSTVRLLIYSSLGGIMFMVLPVAINHVLIPIIMIIISVLIGRVIGNIQKRL